MDDKIFTLYQTNHTLDAAMRDLCPKRGVDTITAVTFVNAAWWHGKKMPYALEKIHSAVIYKA